MVALLQHATIRKHKGRCSVNRPLSFRLSNFELNVFVRTEGLGLFITAIKVNKGRSVVFS